MSLPRILIVPPIIKGMMTGTQYAFQELDGGIGLVYESGREEIRPTAGVNIRAFAEYFQIVTYVQEGILPATLLSETQWSPVT